MRIHLEDAGKLIHSVGSRELDYLSWTLTAPAYR